MMLRRRLALWICPELRVGAMPVAKAAPEVSVNTVEVQALILLAAALAAHTGRTEATIARWCGAHNRLFSRLREGHGCNVRTAEATALALFKIWPADLAWPREVPIPKTKKDAA